MKNAIILGVGAIVNTMLVIAWTNIYIDHVRPPKVEHIWMQTVTTRVVEREVPVHEVVEKEVPIALTDDTLCLAHNIYHEARGESRAGQIQVAFATVNRVGRKHWADSICGVVHQRRQFSWVGERPYINFKGVAERNSYRDAIEIAHGVLNGQITNNLGADHYYNPNKVNPPWGEELTLVGVIGNHKFLRW